jgi:uncharacterized protein YhdP
MELFSSQAQWDAAVSVVDILWHELPIERLEANLVWDRRTLAVRNIQAGVSSGTVTGTLSLSSSSPAGFQTFSTKGAIRDVEMGPVFFAFSTNPLIIAGRLSSDFSFSGFAQPGHLDKLNGEFTVSGRDGYFRKGRVLADVFANLNLTSLFKPVSERRRSGLPFDVIEATADVRDGRFYFDAPAAVKGPGLEMMFTGWVSADFESGQGTLVINALVGSRNFLQAIPGVSQLIIGDSGEFLPLIVDLTVKPGKIEKKFRSIKTLASPVLGVIGNVIRLPETLFKASQKKPAE